MRITRTPVLIFLTASTILAGATFYVWIQPNTPIQTADGPTTLRSALPKSAPTTDQSPGGVQEGEQGVFKIFDDKTGALSRIFRVGKYEPRGDGTIDVDDPQAEFYFEDGQVLVINGTRGQVIVPGAAGKSADFRGSMGPPSRGELHDVTLSLFPPGDRVTPAMVFTTNNVSFDNDTLRIATEAFTGADGKLVPADQVPVQLRGQQYDFDGRGLTVRWNDRDKRLEVLEVAHGESLTVKSGLAPGNTVPAPARAAEPATRPVAARGRPRRPTATAPALAAAASPPRQTVYRATFEGPVRATQGDTQLAAAKTMYVDFAPQQSDAEGRAGAQAPARDAPRQPRQRRDASAASQLPQPAASQPAAPQLPIVLRWPGKLVVVPLTDSSAAKLRPGDMRIEMVSTDEPVVLNDQGRVITCASFVYADADDSLTVRTSPLVPVITMTDSSGARFVTPALVYDGATKMAVMKGASHGEIPIKDEKTGKVEILTATWTDRCVLTMDGPTKDDLTIQHAQMVGNVKYDHPRLKLTAQQTDVDFAPPDAPKPTERAGSAQIQKLIATGDVKCDMTDEQEKIQHITTDRLSVQMAKAPSGRTVPRVLETDGNVHAFDDDGDLQAGYMKITFAPTTQPTDSPQIEKMVAQHDVRFKSKDASGRADMLDVAASDGDYEIVLRGLEPAASVTSGETTATGALIKMRPKRQSFEIDGPGTLSGMARRNPDDKPTPFNVKWTDGLAIDGQTNHGEVNGGVEVKTVAATDGSTATMSGRQIRIELMDDPTAKAPTSAPAANGTDIAAAFAPMHGKAVRSVLMDGDTKLASELLGADGLPIRQLTLFAPGVQMDQQARTVTIPSGGTMLFVDHPSTTRPSTAEATSRPSQLGGLTGRTAFRWSKQLRFDDAQHTAEMLGTSDEQVLVVHQDMDGNTKFRILSPRMLCELATPDKSTTQPSDVKLKSLSATDGVQFISGEGEIEIHGDHMTFDPETGIVEVIGSDSLPVQILGAKGNFNSKLDRVMYNTKTQELMMGGGKMAGGR